MITSDLSMKRFAVIALLAPIFWAPVAFADSGLQLHASHVVRVPDDLAQGKIYVLTSPDYIEAAAAESPRTISAQILRIAVFTSGDEQRTYINMANPVAHAMVYYADSAKYDDLVAAAFRPDVFDDQGVERG